MPVTNPARSTSKDPAQERLKKRKKVWNTECSAFISRLNAFKPGLIAFKQGLNGTGNAKAGLPPSDIKEPLPPEIAGFMGIVNSTFSELASEFAALVSESNSIIQEQTQYAEHRRKPQPHKLRQPRQPRQADMLELDDTLIVEGSNRITRLWAQLSSVLNSDETKRQRLSMLGLSDKFFKNLVKFEDLILTNDISEMEKILNGYLLISNNLDSLKHNLVKLLKIKNKGLPKVPDFSISQSPPATSSPPSPQQNEENFQVPKGWNEARSTNMRGHGNASSVSNPSGTRIGNMDMHQLKEKIVLMMQLGFTVDDVRIFLEIYHKNKTEKDPNKIALVTDRLQDIYRDLFLKLKNKIEKEIGQKLPKNITLEEIKDLKSNASISNINEEIIKLSGNFISRYYNKYKHERSKDPSSASRIDIYNSIRDMKINVDTIMNLLEKKQLDTDELIAKITATEEQLSNISEPLQHLNMLYKDKYYEPGSNKRKHNILDPAGRFFNRQIQQDIDKPDW